MSDKYIMIDVNDPRSAVIADVISNKTCKKILGLLAEKERSEGDLSKSLDVPLNTIGYNVKKLVDVGLIEKVNKFFWSSKGKRISTYKLSNKKIVISPKDIIKGIVPAVVISGVIAWVIKLLIPGENYSNQIGASETLKAASDSGAMAFAKASSQGLFLQYIWLWFLLGALTSLFIYLIWNLIKK